MNDITVEEALTRKAQLEVDICRLLREFEHSTGMFIDSVECTRVDITALNDRGYTDLLNDVNIRVRL